MCEDIGHVSYWAKTFSLVSKMLASYAEIEGMRADNKSRKYEHEDMMWSGNCFRQEAEKLRTVSQQLEEI